MVHFHRHDTVTNAPKIKDITSDKINRNILHRLKTNDPSFTSMNICNLHHRFSKSDNEYCPSGAYDLGWLGYFIGKNQHLENIALLGARGTPDVGVTDFLRQHMISFCKGVNHNKSIRVIELCGLDLLASGIFQLLGPFFKK